MAGLSGLLNPWFLALIGLCVGSFVNVVVHRLPQRMDQHWWQATRDQLADADAWRHFFGHDPAAAIAPAHDALDQALAARAVPGLARPRSRCPHCGHALAWHENLPLIGWLRLRGRCAHCGERIALRYPLVEAGMALAFAATTLAVGEGPLALLWCAVVAVLICAALIDWDTTLLPDSLTLPLLWAGLLAALAGWTVPLPTALVGAAAGYGALWSIFWIFKLLTGKEGMGYGDFKLLAALGAWLGWQALLPVVLMASVLGAAVGIALKLRGGLRHGPYVPFGPFLVGGALAVLWAGMPRVMDVMGWA
ncbi:prepilin peptidase [Amphibiibacter pelophylacis]|uniref:prepilin peptidase n=1 Tax=Amphibiibacter pelophylacis TaxID=1799477 RepID=UPI003BFA77CA